MSLRPVAATWFEVLVLREDLTAALDVLARSSRIELQGHGEARQPLLDTASRQLLEEFAALERRHAPYWPAPKPGVAEERREPLAMLAEALARLRRWAGDAEPLIERLESLERRREDLALLHDLLAPGGDTLPDLAAVSSAGPLLTSRLYLLPEGRWPEALPANLITRRLAVPGRAFLLCVGLPEDCASLDEGMRLQKARRVTIPDALPADPGAAARAVADEVQVLAAEIDDLRERMARLGEENDVAAALADARFVLWFVDNVPDLSSTEHFAWISGWTSDPDEDALLELLSAAGVKGLLRLSAPPPGLQPPLLLKNPKWSQPFEIFTGMLGVPAAGEVDPTRIVAIAGPLMFGFMFGDVGHGAVLLAAGLLLQRRYPALRLLVAGGAASIVFGFLFGSAFALEDLVPALWVRPMEEPLLMFAVPMAGGAVLLLVGMCLDAVQAAWQHRARDWWLAGAGLLLCYLALLGSLLDTRLLWAALVGGAWYIAGHAIAEPSRALAAGGLAAGELAESLLQLAVNTVSFVRVGAFALAHAGLSSAVVGLSQAPTSAAAGAVVLVFGNVLVIGLEGLVVGIQTTRLVLFEFFVRFLRAGGRPFRPLPPVPGEPSARNRRS